ncbi:MAG: aldolase [Ruminococcaceae bacterium]|nr:aldolase [Oscillospiraceae bacterium]
MKFMYITNQPQIAKAALRANVDILFVDMEYIGKDKRQKGMDTVQNHHTFDDIRTIRKVIDGFNKKNASLLVRVNPIHNNSKSEIEEAIQSGADIIMLPMWKTLDEVKKFVTIINGRAKAYLLLENKEAAKIIDDVLNVFGIDGIYIGLNDLHLSYENKFMFEPLANGTVDLLAQKINEKKLDFGFGGIAKLREGTLPAEKILAEHIRLNSQMVILSRKFCSITDVDRITEIEECFMEGIGDIKKEEQRLKQMDNTFLAKNQQEVKELVRQIVKRMTV